MSAPHPTQSTSADTAGGSHVTWIFDLAVREGRDDEFRALMAEMVAGTRRDEPGALDYEWFLTDDGRRLHILERYADGAAAMTHLGNFGARYMKRFFDVLVPQGITLYGAAGDDVRGALAELHPVVMQRADGFSR